MKKIIAFSLVFLMIGCGPSKTLSSLGWSKGCPLERLDWMEVSSGYDSKTIIDIASKLEASAKSDATSLKTSGEAKGSLTASLNDIINKDGKGTIKVSQEFYQSYVNKRLAICSIYQGVKDGIIKNEVARQKAENAYIDLATSFGIVNDEEEKKNR